MYKCVMHSLVCMCTHLFLNPNSNLEFELIGTKNVLWEWSYLIKLKVLPEYILAGVDFFSNYENEGSGTGCLRVGFSHVHGFLLDKSGAQHFNLQEKANLNHPWEMAGGINIKYLKLKFSWGKAKLSIASCILINFIIMAVNYIIIYLDGHCNVFQS